MKNNILELGKIVNTHALRGEVKIQPWCDDPDIFNDLDYIYIENEKFNILNSRLHKNSVILSLQGINDINTAEKYKNKVITIDRDALGELPDGTYYICDLVGLSVKTLDDEVLGEIEDIIKTGSNDVYVLKSSSKKPILIPVIDDVVKEINIEEGYVKVKLLEGLMD